MEERKQTRLGSDPLSWIKDSRTQKEGRTVQPRVPVKKEVPKTKLGLKEGWIRATFIVRRRISGENKVTVLLGEKGYKTCC